ncbi:MAG: PRC-barrel domain-containing protein [Heliobacteriaceae bacterium]|nr:PRC-barrel domain-containing protein [Heliobacteriaceae bacterium]MDD4588389.1 PRC-barrel domain-containing protein [Heliobacteriaceae bacterium]
MTKSQNIVGLAIISINDGRELGTVRDLIINPEQGAVEYLMVENETWYLGAQVIPFQQLQGVGEYAVTIESEEALKPLQDLTEVQALIDRNVKVKGTKVLTKAGRLVGSVSEYFVDVGCGRIAGCLLMSADKSLSTRIIPAESVVTFGRDVLVVTEELDEAALAEFQEVKGRPVTGFSMPVRAIVPEVAPVEGEPEPALVVLEDVSAVPLEPAIPADPEDVSGGEATAVNPDTVPAASGESGGAGEIDENGPLFGQLQHKYYVGKKLAKRLENNQGEVIAEEGAIVTEELIEAVKQAGKYLELIMNTKE